MAAPPSLPVLSGQAWGVRRKPVFATIVALGRDMREVRSASYAVPLYEYEVILEGLASDSTSYPGLGAQSFQAIYGLFLQCRGSYGSFLYTDPSDSVATAQGLATGDGIKTSFAFARSIGGSFEPVGWVLAVASVTLNGVNQPSGWSLTVPNTLVFVTPPGAGVLVAAGFTYAWVCHFSDDKMGFDNIMQNLWQAKSVKFRSVRSS